MPDLTTVLYADDDDDVRAIAEMALTAVAGISVCAFASGQAALEGAQECAPDLILLDVMMPELDEPSTMTRLREIPSLAATPVVFLTAKIRPDEVDRYHQLGAAGVINKPFDPMTLDSQLREIWSRVSA